MAKHSSTLNESTREEARETAKKGKSATGMPTSAPVHRGARQERERVCCSSQLKQHSGGGSEDG